VEDWAQRLLAALDKAGIGAVRIYAHRGGCAVAVALALLAPARISEVILDSPLAVPDAVRASLVDSYAPEIELSWDGSHLTRTWHHLRDQEFWWPWFDRRQATALTTDPAIAPEALTLRAVGCLRQPSHYRPAWQAVWRYDLLSALALLEVPVTVAVAEGDAFGHLAAAAARTVGSAIQPLPADPRTRALWLTGAGEPVRPAIQEP
jgi:pimeloyl-ACP methyl ester carboxylesterase